MPTDHSPLVAKDAEEDATAQAGTDELRAISEEIAAVRASVGR